MRAAGRLPATPRLPSRTNFIIQSIIICACSSFTAGSEYGVPIEIKLWDTGRTPLAHMVDVTNEFGLKILAEHNFLNDNNIAFSPYGLMGIMVALYEGVDGESSYQIQRGMQLPWNRKVMRIGFRDIHRTLKTYFVPEEGFLAGLALNNENVTFNDQYKTILRFYGFDLDNDQLPTLSPEVNTTVSEVTPAPTPSVTTAVVMLNDSPTTASVTEAPTTAASKEETTPTTNPNAETINTVDIRQDASTTGSAFVAQNTENVPTTPMSTTEQATTERISELTTVSTTTQVASTNTQTTLRPETEPTTAAVTQTSTTSSAQTQTANIQLLEPNNAFTNEPTLNNEVDTSTADGSTMLTTNVDETTITTQSTTLSVTFADTEGTTVPSTMSSILDATETSTSSDSLTTNTEVPTTEASTLETLSRRKKSIVDFIFNDPPYVDDYLYYKSLDVGSPQSSNFLANGLKSVQVTYMQYDTVLEHAYLPHLEASALRLPLDSDRYYLLVVLPTRGGASELGRLLSRMARESDLSDIYSVLRPRRVRGIVPSFIVKGHVTLTTDLQKLGIRDVFEPRQHDFTTMTRQAGVYVRSIEQAVSVAIRKYRPDDQKKHRYVTSRDPVVFSATYPFLYFVMDANIHVALMAGKMVDPLNSRIL